MTKPESDASPLAEAAAPDGPLELPPTLLAWIGRVCPELADARAFRVWRRRRLPFDWLPGDRCRYLGITLWSNVYLRPPVCPRGSDDTANLHLLFHELTHVRQFRRNPIAFPLQYLWQLARYGYRDAPAEIEARAEADRLLGLYLKEISPA